MTSVNVPESWGQWAYVTIEAKGASSDGAVVELNALMNKDSLEIKLGERDFEVIHLANGGCLEAHEGDGPYEISFDIYPRSLDVESKASGETNIGMGLAQFYNTAYKVNVSGTMTTQWDTTASAGVGLTIVNSRNRDNFRVTILFTDDTNIKKATDAVPIGSCGYRLSLSNARFTEMSPLTLGDKILKASCTFKARPFSRLGAGNFTQNSTIDGTTSIAALTAYV